MRDRDTIHGEIDRAQSDLEASLAELKDAVRYEVDPTRNAEKVIELGRTKLRELLLHAWQELLALVREIKHTRETEGLRAALKDVWTMLVAATRDLRGALMA